MEHRYQNEEFDEQNSYFLEPGAIFFSPGGGMVRTVVGNSVAICIWDRMLQCGGMTNFIYPYAPDLNKATAHYADAAITALLKLMKEAGAQKSDLMAQVIGGAIPEHDESNKLGVENTVVAKGVLFLKGIKIVSEDIGGNMGRKIIFDIGSGHAAVYKVHRIRENDWHKKNN